MRQQHDAMTRAAKAAGLLAALLLASAPAAAQMPRRALSVSAVVVPVCTASTAARGRLACSHAVGATVSTTPALHNIEQERIIPRVRSASQAPRPADGVRYTTISF